LTRACASGGGLRKFFKRKKEKKSGF